jgi:ribosome-associated protein
MITFNLAGHEYIQLNQLLKITNLVGSGGEAMICISQGEVLFNGEVETQKRKKIRIGDKVEFREQVIEVEA